MFTAFEYMYRDAGNFKAFGSVLLRGPITSAQETAVREQLSSGDLFIAEQIGVPALYGQLYQWRDGPTESDHCWHEFVGFSASHNVPVDAEPADNIADFVQRFTSVEEWHCALSPHWHLK